MGAEANNRRRMSRGLLAAAWLVSASLAGACSDDEEPVGLGDPPDGSTRALPERTAPDPLRRPDASIEAGIPDDYVSSFDPGECCAVEFALDAEPGEVYAILRGTDAPLDSPDGIAMTYDAGVWTLAVCMPPNYTGVYYYELFSVPDGGDDGGIAPAEPIEVSNMFDPTGLFRSTRHNPAALSEQNETLGQVNLFPASDACGGTDAGLHSTVSGNSSGSGSDAGL